MNKLHNYIIEVTVVTRCVAKEILFIFRIPLITSDLLSPLNAFNFRLEFFALKVNKAQSQTFKMAGINIRIPRISLTGNFMSSVGELVPTITSSFLLQTNSLEILFTKKH